MTIEEVAMMFRRLVDEPDTTFFSDAEVAAALKQGYAEFRGMVFKAMPEVYERTYSANVVGNSLALAGVLFGASPTQPRCLRVTRIEQVSDTTATATFQGLLDAAASKESLYSLGYPVRWLLQGTNLLFSENLTRAIRINYLPADQLNWTAGIVPASNVSIDDITDYHDLIALFAVQQYAIKDFASNKVLMQQYAKRVADFQSFLSSGRGGDAARWVQSEGDGW